MAALKIIYKAISLKICCYAMKESFHGFSMITNEITPMHITLKRKAPSIEKLAMKRTVAAYTILRKMKIIGWKIVAL